jgi:alkylation response protein AidB-like acyl-CoA dehydrogenase
MDFEVADAYAEHRQAARDWAVGNVDPAWVAEQERTGTYHTAELHRRLAADGFLGAGWPAEYGGTDVSPALATAVFQEILGTGVHLDGWVTTQMVLNTVLHVGTEEQKRSAVAAGARGEMLIVLGYTEPGCGSDAAAAATRAVRDGDEWVINGSKMFTSTAHEATHVFLLTRTNTEAAKHRGLTTFLVPLSAPGVSVQPIHTLGGQRTNATYYSDVRVGDECRIGEIDGGWGVMRVALVYERGLAQPSAGPTWAERAAAWGRAARRDDGSAVLDSPVFREQLARIAVEEEIARLLAARVSWLVESGGMPALEGPLSKLFSTESRQRYLSALMDFIGESAVLTGNPGARHGSGDGSGEDFPAAVEDAFRKSVVTTIYGGTSEIMREIIAERHLGLPRARPA